MMHFPSTVLVIGSINIDEFNYVKYFPNIGESIIANEINIYHGGKGANQAIATKRLSKDPRISVFLFAKVGNDRDGQKEIEHLISNNIKTDYVKTSKEQTGKATIIISYLDGDNKVITYKGANNDFSISDRGLLEEAIKKCDVVLLQLEINHILVDMALKFSNKYQKIVVMNPAPALNFDHKWLKYIDWFIPKASELELIINKKINNINQIESELNFLRMKGLKNAIVTLGASGIYVSTDKLKKWIGARKVPVVDITAAGDTFIGSFVANTIMISQEKEFLKSIVSDMKAASLSIQKKGSQSSIPWYKEVAQEKKNKIVTY